MIVYRHHGKKGGKKNVLFLVILIEKWEWKPNEILKEGQ